MFYSQILGSVFAFTDCLVWAYTKILKNFEGTKSGLFFDVKNDEHNENFIKQTEQDFFLQIWVKHKIDRTIWKTR